MTTPVVKMYKCDGCGGAHPYVCQAPPPGARGSEESRARWIADGLNLVGADREWLEGVVQDQLRDYAREQTARAEAGCPEIAHEIVDYYRGICRAFGLNDLPLQDRLVEAIALRMSAHSAAFAAKQTARYQKGLQHIFGGTCNGDPWAQPPSECTLCQEARALLADPTGQRDA